MVLMAGVCSSALATDSLLCEMKNSLRAAAFCASVVAGVSELGYALFCSCS